MEGDSLSWDYLLVPVGLCVLGIYHIWLLITVLRNPTKTVMGLNSAVRKQWVFSMMADPMKNGVLIIQTLRNNIMASSLLATTAITLSSVISVFVSTSSSSSSDSTVSQQLVYTIPLSSIKYFCILLCFLVGFLCNVQSTRYFAHASFLATLPTGKDKTDYIEFEHSTSQFLYFSGSLGQFPYLFVVAA